MSPGPAEPSPNTRAYARIVIADPWEAFVAPLLTEEQFARELQVDSFALDEAVRWLQILRLTTDDGHQLYPAWQLDGGTVVAGLQPVLGTLRTGTEDEWSWALWLCSIVRDDDHGDGVRRQIDELVAGNVAPVLRRAAQMAEGWAAGG